MDFVSPCIADFVFRHTRYRMSQSIDFAICIKSFSMTIFIVNSIFCTIIMFMWYEGHLPHEPCAKFHSCNRGYKNQPPDFLQQK